MSSTESRHESGGVGQKAQAAVRSAAETIKQRAAETTSRVKESATEMAEERRDQVAGTMHEVGSALHETAQSIEDQDPNIAWLTEQASSRLERAAEYVRSCSWQQLREDGADFARRHPVAFFGGMFAVGLAAGALAKAAMQSAAESADDDMSHGGAEDTVPPPSDTTVSPGTEEPYAVPAATI